MKISWIFVITLLFTGTASAVVDPEIIQWRANNNVVFVNSLYQGVLGRLPTQEELGDSLAKIASNTPPITMGRGEAFWSLLGSQEYNRLFGSVQGEYEVFFKSPTMDVEWSNRTWCNCYYFTKDPALSIGLRPAMQYVGTQTPWRSYNFTAARAVQRMYAVYDANTCPRTDCGMNASDVAAFFERLNNSGNSRQSSNTNLVRDTNFSNFMSGPWGSNVLYGQNGIWWNSNNAQTIAQTVNLSGGAIPTALRIVNSSGRAAHVFGTTAQRINVQRGGTYQISFFGYARDLASNGGIVITVDPQWKVQPISMPSGTYDWQKFTGTFVASDDYIDLRIISQDRGEILISSMSMVRIQ